jgi:phage terminase Nu1 subunit (DNA packaging protein)
MNNSTDAMPDKQNGLSEKGKSIKRRVDAIAEMEEKIFSFLAQQHVDFLEDEIIFYAVKSVAFKLEKLT